MEIDKPGLDLAPELSKIERSKAKAELYSMFGLDTRKIESPPEAPKTIDFEKFWRKSGFADKRLFLRKEVFLGADYDSKTGLIKVTERSVGGEYEVDSKRDHLVNFHSEPRYNSAETPITQLIEEVPDAYFGDVENFLTDKNIICEIIMRMIDKTNAGVVVLLKTEAHLSETSSIEFATKFKAAFQTGLKTTFINDRTLVQKNKVAVYRGFVDLPVKKDISPLRLRRY